MRDREELADLRRVGADGLFEAVVPAILIGVTLIGPETQFKLLEIAQAVPIPICGRVIEAGIEVIVCLVDIGQAVSVVI